MKHPISLIVFFIVTGGIALAGHVNWQGTNLVRDGQIIAAEIIKDNFDYLYERSWDYIANSFVSDRTVVIMDTVVSPNLALDVEANIGAEMYCDENGDHCVDIANVVPVPPECNQRYFSLNWDGTGWICRDNTPSYSWNIGQWDPRECVDPRPPEHLAPKARCIPAEYYRNRTVQCVTDTGVVVADANCAQPKPDTRSRCYFPDDNTNCSAGPG